MSSIAVIFDHRIKNPSKLENGFGGKLNSHLGVFILPTKAPFFFIWWAVLPNIYEIISLETGDYIPYCKRFLTVS